MRRLLTAGVLASSFALVTLAAPATASAVVLPGWCLGPGPCTVTADGWCLGDTPCDRAPTPDGWCLTPSEDICRRY
ncbi:hypothetical protein AB0K15_04415 [Amycolatopsis sp. NPDC049253]|uniref:hypothetical protein n=1 Tax=Amycolatopsis sp. NPDC049253 TaxID=3155274 RepID=UPI003412D5D9